MSPDSMNAGELKQYRQHTIRGQMAIDNIEDLRPAALLIRHHHENFDGSGFPDRLTGDAIPIGARILAYADSIDKASETCTGDIASLALAKTGLLVGTTLDPALHKIFRKVTRLTYHSLGDDQQELVEVELDVQELRADIQLSRDVISGSGILLLSRGIVLDETKIESIRRNYRLDAPSHGVFVLLNR
jgi:hypothetical protein